ncbi:MAG TPA: alpha/beta hydrolase [Acidimicrobiales bacterium]
MDIEIVDIDANGLTFTARMAGPADGQPVLLLHGFPQTSLCWQDELSALGEAGYRVVAPDQRGYSAGARPSGVADYAVAHLVADTLAIADRRGMDTFHLVGHDWGGYLAWVVAARHPERIRTLTSVSTPHPTAMGAAIANADGDQAQRSSYIGLFRQDGTAEEILLGEDGSGEGLRQMYLGAGLSADKAEAYVEAMTVPGVLTAGLNWYRAMDAETVRGVGIVGMPTMYVWSSEDIALGRRAAEDTASWVSGPYRFEVLEGVSHWIPDEAAETLNALLLDHLGSPSG